MDYDKVARECIAYCALSLSLCFATLRKIKTTRASFERKTRPDPYRQGVKNGQYFKKTPHRRTNGMPPFLLSAPLSLFPFLNINNLDLRARRFDLISISKKKPIVSQKFPGGEKQQEGRVSSHDDGRQKCVLTSRRTRRLYPAVDNIPVGGGGGGGRGPECTGAPGTYIFFRGSPHK